MSSEQSAQKEMRQYQRHARRAACSFQSPEGTQRGFITNVSARGFFIQTRNRLEPATEIVVTIENDPDPPMIVTGTVARARSSHRSMSSIDQSGIGVQIDSAPEDYYRLVLELEEKK